MQSVFGGSISSARLVHVVLWCAQAVLAATFAATALLKLLSQPDRLVEIMAWTSGVPRWSLYALATLELVGASLVAAPVVTRTPQRIVGFTAAALSTLAGLFSAVHIYRGELRMIPVTLAIAALAALVAWGRLTHEPLESIEP